MGANRNGTIQASVVAGTTDSIGEVEIHPRAEIAVFEVFDANSFNLDAFEIQAKVPGGTYVAIASAQADFVQATVKHPVLTCTADLTTMTKNTRALVIIDVRGFSYLKFLASCAAAGPSVVTIKYSM